MIYISPAIVLSETAYASLANPVFLWENLVTFTGIMADEEDADYPATNLANPQTSSLWKSGSTADQDIVFDIDPQQPVNAFGIARHNFGTGHVGVKLYGITAEPGAVFELLADLSPGDDSPILAIVEGDYYVQGMISLEPDTVEPQAAVVYIGTALIMPRSTPVGFVPLPDALVRDTLTGIAENGDFLGDIIVSERLSTTVDFRSLDGDWYRANMRSFVQAGIPFFYCWSPTNYPDEGGFAKFEGVPQGNVAQWRGEMDVSMRLVGLAL
jgi:hypothetical protein